MRRARERLNRARLMLQSTFADRDPLATVEAMNILAELEIDLRHQEILKFDAQIQRRYSGKSLQRQVA